jgi:PqqD family protein of HPr-rel-A system
MKWHLASIGQIYECGETTVAYFEPASGDTHLISAFAAHLVQQLGRAPAPLGIQEIISQIKDDIEPEDLQGLAQDLSAILNELADLDIVTSH